MNQLGDRNYTLISDGIKSCDSFNPDICFVYFEEQLYMDEADEIEAFLRWVHEDELNRAFGSGNYEQRFQQFLNDSKK